MRFFLGQIQAFGFNFAPRGWAKCDGQLLPIAQNTALFSLLGTIYGGDGRTTFGLPDLRGRVPMHAGNGPGLTPRPQGQKYGTETNNLTTAQMPAHNHSAQVGGDIRILASDYDADADTAGGNYMASGPGGAKMYSPNVTASTSMGAPDISGLTVTVGNAGASQPINNMQPYTVVNYCICLQGDFPSRS